MDRHCRTVREKCTVAGGIAFQVCASRGNSGAGWVMFANLDFVSKVALTIEPNCGFRGAERRAKLAHACILMALQDESKHC